MVPSLSQVTWIIILSLLSGPLAMPLGAKVRCDPKTRVTAGQSVTLQCQISCEDVLVGCFVWKKNSDIVVAFDNGKITHKERFMFNQQPFNSSTRDVSLHIVGVTEEDEGKYSYRISSDCVMEEGFTHLIVDDPPTTQTPTAGSADKLNQMTPTPEKPERLGVALPVVVVVLLAVLLAIGVIIKRKSCWHHVPPKCTNQREEESYSLNQTPQ